jgi:hypothetical protein
MRTTLGRGERGESLGAWPRAEPEKVHKTSGVADFAKVIATVEFDRA